METKQCYACGKSPLSKDEIGLVKKLIDKKAEQFYCLSCLADYFEVTEEELLAKVEQSKKRGVRSLSEARI